MKKVIIYTSDTCPYCNAAKEYLIQKHVPYVEHNIHHEPKAKETLMKKGYRGVPVIFVDDAEVMGFDQEKLDELL